VFTILKPPAALTLAAYISCYLKKKLLYRFRCQLAETFYGLCSAPDVIVVDPDLLSRSLQVIDILGKNRARVFMFCMNFASPKPKFWRVYS
jgi:hypothetical protein